MTMISRSRLVSLLLACALTAAVVPAFPEAPKSRGEALKSLASPNTTTRAEAVVWIANRGAMSDAPLLHERLRDESGLVRSYAEQGLWLLWSRSGDSAIDALMARGIEEMQAERLAEAIGTFAEVIGRKPDFAEGWNKRATAYYLAGQFERSLADCDEVLKRNPNHFGALSGAGQIHFALENFELALVWFRRALEVNPNMTGVEINIHRTQERLQAKRRNTT
ncbi:MAG TPA: tetratricopeptide repeat protein [Burkholderiales bacterium]|nr:tetratricopeptide repeat protein [Burkholderiales bacterium]